MQSLKPRYYLLFQYLSNVPRLPEDRAAVEALGECWITLLVPTDDDDVDMRQIWRWIENREGFVARGSCDRIDTEKTTIAIDERKIVWLVA